MHRAPALLIFVPRELCDVSGRMRYNLRSLNGCMSSSSVTGGGFNGNAGRVRTKKERDTQAKASRTVCAHAIIRTRITQDYLFTISVLSSQKKGEEEEKKSSLHGAAGAEQTNTTTSSKARSTSKLFWFFFFFVTITCAGSCPAHKVALTSSGFS